MAKSNGLNFNLPSVDDLFSTEEERAEARLEKVVNLSPTEISDFPNHPFKVRMDAAMQEMAESVKQYGVLVPALVRPKRSGHHFIAALWLGAHQGRNQNAVLLHAFRHFLHGCVHPHLKRVIREVADFRGRKVDDFFKPCLGPFFLRGKQVID